MKKSIFSFLWFLVLALGIVGETGAITFGEPDGDAHPYVGTLLFVQNGVGFYSCTGTLIAPTLMVTAGHCVEEAGNPNDITYVRFTEDALADLDSYGSVQDWLNNEWILASAVYAHPEFDDMMGRPDTHDVGVVILSEPVILGAYGALPSLGFLDGVLAERGNSDNWFTAVGYGLQGFIDPFYGEDYARYQANTRLVELNSYFTGPGSSAKFTNNPGRVRGGTCFGDSGGPVFFQDSAIIGAIVSFGITPCIGVDYQYRLDTPEALDFINSHRE